MNPSAFEVVKFIVATILACAMLAIHAFVKDLPVMLMVLPYFLMGIPPETIGRFFGGLKK